MCLYIFTLILHELPKIYINPIKKNCLLSDIKELQHVRFPWTLPLKFQQYEQLKLNKGLPAQHKDTLRDPYIEASKGGQTKMKQVRQAGRRAQNSNGFSPAVRSPKQGSSQRGEKASCGSFFLQLGEAGRLSGNSYGSEQCKLQLSEENWTRTEHRGSDTALGWLTLQTKKESYRGFYSKQLSILSVKLRTVSTKSLYLLSKAYTL